MLATSHSVAVLVQEWCNFRTLLPICLDGGSCESLLEDPGPTQVIALLLASSGAADLNPPKWLQIWEPQLVLLSVGSWDRRAHPAPEVLDAVQNSTLLCSDQNGWGHLSTDGE